MGSTPMAVYPRESPQLGEHNRPLRVGATHREATKPSEAPRRPAATKEALIFEAIVKPGRAA